MVKVIGEGIGQEMSIRLIIFDLDGTLADTAADMADALNAVLPPSIAPVSLDEARMVMGGGTDTLAARFGSNRSDVERRDFRKRFAAEYARRLAVHTRLYPGVRATLRKLGVFSKVVLSNRTTALTVPVLERFNLRPYFLDVIGMDSGAGMKPSAEPVLHVLARFSSRPNEAVIVGDCANDIDAGRAAGVCTVAATYGYGVDRSLIERADFVIDRFSKLLEVIRQLDSASPPH
jgi:HAD superfamily hydrolase (TIGR01509 family)